MKTAAELAEMDPDEFRLLNPSFNLPVIVASHNSVMLLPMENLEVFMDNRQVGSTPANPFQAGCFITLKRAKRLPMSP